MEYSCAHRPSNFKHIHSKPLEVPKENTHYWHLANLSNDMPKEAFIEATRKVFSDFQEMFDNIEPKGRILHLKSTSDLSKANIIISFGKGVHDIIPPNGKKEHCFYHFDGRGGVLMHAWSLLHPYPYGGQVHIDDDEVYRQFHWLNEDGTFDVKFTTPFKHEIGHVYDADHSQIYDAVMFGSYTGEKDTFHTDDILCFQSKIGPLKREILKRSDKEVPQEIQERSISLMERIILWIRKLLS